MLPRPWDFPGKRTGMCCHFLLQRIFLTQGSNLGLPHCRQMLYRLSHQWWKILLCSVQFSCSVLSDSMRPTDCSMPGLPVHHQLLEFTQTHAHWVGDAIDFKTCMWLKQVIHVKKWKWSCSVVSDSLRPCGLCPWDFPGRVLEWVAISFSRESSWPRDRTPVSHIVGRCFTVWATRKSPVNIILWLINKLNFIIGMYV